MSKTPRRLAAIALCAIMAASFALAENGPTPFNFRVKLDKSGDGGVVVPPLTPNDPNENISVTIIGPMNGQVSTPFAMTASATGASAKTWTLAPSSGSLPPGLSLDAATGSISGETNVAGLSSVLVLKAANAAGAYGLSAPFRLNFLTQAQTASASYAGPLTAVLGSQYAGSATSSGLTAPVRWTLGSGTLPSGLNLDPASGQVSGIPGQVETRTGISLIARGANGVSAVTPTFQIAVSDASPGALALVMPDVTTYVGQFVSRRAVAYGGTPRLVTNHVSALPDGLVANEATVSGVPTTPGTFTGLVAVANDAGGATAQTTYKVTVLPAQATTITMSSRTVTVGESLSMFPGVANATQPASFSLSQGSLPPGTSLDPNNGSISGTPTTVGTYAGNVLTVVDAIGRTASTTPFTITVVQPAPLRVSVASASFPYNSPYSIPIVVSGTKPGPYTYALQSGTLPQGVTVGGGTGPGTVGGSATETGSKQGLSVRVTSADGTQAVSNVFYINVRSAGSIEIVMPEEIGPGTIGQRYDTAFSVRGLNGTGPVTGPITWMFVNSSLSEIPHPDMPGLRLDTSSGAITGTPTASFDHTNLRLHATDAAGRTAHSESFRLAAKPDFSLEWETGYTAPPERVKKNAYFSAYAKVLDSNESYFSSWWYRKRGNVNRLWEAAGQPIAGMAVGQGGTFSGYNTNVTGPKRYALKLTDARGLTRRTPDHTTQFIDTSYIAEYNPVTMSECGGSSGDNYLFGGTWTSVNGKAVWTGWTGTKYSTHNPPRPWPSPAANGQGFDFYVKVENYGHSGEGGTISIRVDQHRQLEGKIQLGNLLTPSDNGWLYVTQTNPGNMPSFGSGKYSIFGTYGGIYATFGQAGTFWERVVLKDWRTGVDVPYDVEVVVRPRDPPICGFTVTF